MAALRARSTPERRRSQFFSSLSLTPRSSKHGQQAVTSPTSDSHLKIVESTPTEARTVNLKALLRKLNPDIPMFQCLAACEQLSSYLTDYRISPSDVLDIWCAILGLIDIEDAELCDAGYNLLATFLAQPDLLQFQRLEILGSLPIGTPIHTLHRPRILSALLSGGRNVEGLEQSILNTLTDTMVECLNLYRTSRAATAQGGNTSSDVPTLNPSPIATAESFHIIVKLITDSIKHGKSLITSGVPRLLDLISDIMRSSKKDPNTEGVLSILGALIIYDHIPAPALLTVIRCLCYVRNETARNEHAVAATQAWKIFKWLLSTHLEDLVVATLLSIQESRSTANAESFGEASGALQILGKTIEDPVLCSSVDVHLERLLASFSLYSTETQSSDVSSEVNILRILVEKEHVRQKLVVELDWENLTRAIVAISTRQGKVQATARQQDNPFFAVLNSLDQLPGLSPGQKDSLRSLYIELSPSLPSNLAAKLLSTYESPFDNATFIGEIRHLARAYIQGPGIALDLRLLTISILQTACLEAQWRDPPQGSHCARLVLESLGQGEEESSVQAKLVECALQYFAPEVEEESFFVDMVGAMSGAMRRIAQSNRSALQTEDPDRKTSTARHVAAGLVVLFMRSINDAVTRSKLIYQTLLGLIDTTDADPAATVMLLRGLFRMRSDVKHRMFMVTSPEGEGLAAALCRTVGENPPGSRRPSRQSGMSDHAPVWMYGEIRGLPEDPPASVSLVLYSKSTSDGSSDSSLDMRQWLTYVIRVIEHGADWESYSYAIVHLGAQLTNQTLFTEAIPQIQQLRRLICRQLLGQTFQKPPESSDLKRADIAVCLYHILTMLIGYHDHFSRSETEEMISAFIFGMSAWDRTTVHCVHALTLCCYELPESLKRDLVRIISQMATIVTKSDAAIHVLEFLAGLSRLTHLTRSFHGEEIKTVFGVCFSYIDYVRGKRFDDAQQRARSGAYPLTRQVGAHAESPDARATNEDIGQYVFALAYHVIVFWYLTLKEEDRNKYLPWMQQRLVSTDQAGNVEDQALVTLDLIWRTTRRNVTTAAIMPPSQVQAPISASWISHYSLLTIAFDAEQKYAGIVERRPSGTDEWRIPLNEDANPEAVFSKHFTTDVDRPFPTAWDPQLFHESDATRRAVAMFDRTSSVDFFKAGVVYVGENQSREADILGNVMGSPDYNLLLAGLGSRLNLLDCKHNTAGLDKSEAQSDGVNTIWHRDDVTALIYLVTTVMPTDRKNDPTCIKKKAHIGNCFVTIVFNNSGHAFAFDTFPSAFNYVYIVITPEARATFIETRTRSRESGWFEDSWFKVQVLTRADFPNISSAAETKVVSGRVLAVFVRNLALNACVFCNVWANRGSGGEYPSSWRHRLTQLRTLKERYGAPADEK